MSLRPLAPALVAVVATCAVGVGTAHAEELKCPSCGKTANRGKFCPNDGARLVSNARPTCTKCSRTFRPGTKFCSEDGSRLSTSGKPKQDVSHVRKGQKYHFTTETRAGGRSTRTDMVWTITDVGRREIRYDLTTVMHIPNMKPIRNTVRNQRVPLASGPAKTGWGGKTKTGGPIITNRPNEVLTISGMRYDCKVTVIDASSQRTMSWSCNKFPFSIRVHSGNFTYRLTRIEGLPAGAGGGGDAKFDVSHVRVGYRYHFKMQNNMSQVWEITRKGSDYVMFKTTTIFQGREMPGGRETRWPPQQKTAAKTWKTGSSSRPATNIVRRETITIGGVRFDCKVHQTGSGGKTGSGSMTWITNKFPGFVKSVYQGKTVMELTMITGRGGKTH